MDGKVVTSVLGVDAGWGHMLAGVAVSLSEGKGTFDNPGVDMGSIESALTTVSPYARFRITERVTAWGLLGWGKGDMTIVQDAREATAERPARPRMVTKTDIGMRMGRARRAGCAHGARGAGRHGPGVEGGRVLRADGVGQGAELRPRPRPARTGCAWCWRAGAGSTLVTARSSGPRWTWDCAMTAVTRRPGRVSRSVVASPGATRPRGSRSRRTRGRCLCTRTRTTRNGGASAMVRFDPGERGRGLSFSLAPTIGAPSSATERLWGAEDARGLAPDAGSGSGFEAARGVQAELGYGLALFGDRFAGTPNAGFSLADGGARDWRVGWRLTSMVPGDPAFEVNLDATRSDESANDNGPAHHSLALRGTLRW